MNHPVAQPDRLQPAACPLLAAVLPVRYALGPIAPRNPSSLDAATLGLPEIQGLFPDLGPSHPQLKDHLLGYVPRMLRDGWLYVWEESLQELTEYQVDASLLTATDRGRKALSHEAQAYLMLEAGAQVGLAWSPVCWSNAQFSAAEQQPSVRQRVLRTLIPGTGCASGPLQALHPQIADVKPENLSWSSAPKPGYWLLQERPLKRMQRCEQQHYALVDDPWGVLFDLAGLLRARTQAFDTLSRVRADDWAIAATIKSISDSDSHVRAQLDSLLDVNRLKATLQEPEREQEALDADRQRIADIWVQWFSTLGGSTAASLETACGHFDITQADARDALEASFAAAFLGPGITSTGVKAIESALDPASTAGKPWLLWALLGVRQRIDPGQLKQLLHIPENLAPVADEVGKAATSFTRAVALAGALNSGVGRFDGVPLAGSSEPLPAALAPILGGRLPSLGTQIHQHAYTLMLAMLARSQQQMDVLALTPKQSLLWLSEQMGQSHNKSQRRSQRKRIEQLERAEQRAARTSTNQPPAKSPVSTGVQEQIPHLRMVPKPQSAPAHPQPGYGSEAPSAPGKLNKPAPVLPPIRGGTIPDLPSNIVGLLDDAPLKTLIAMVAAWNVGVAGNAWNKERTGKNFIAGGSAALATLTAASAVLQQLADTDWKRHIAKSGKINEGSQKLLANALGAGGVALFLQSITAGIDVFYYGWQALDAYRTGDLDSAGVYTGMAGANMAYARVSVQALRAMRIARAAVLAGEGEALATGLRVLSLPLRLSLLGLTVTIFLGMVSLFYTQDTPLEQWLKQTRFGTRPADWANTFAGSMRAFYQIVLPVRMSLESWNEQNPRTGEILKQRRLYLRLPGQQLYHQGMISFEGHEEWTQKTGLFASASRRIPLAWSDEDTIPFDLDNGTRSVPEPDGSVRLRRAYHDDGLSTLTRVEGRLTYQPIENLYLPPIHIDLS